MVETRVQNNSEIHDIFQKQLKVLIRSEIAYLLTKKLDLNLLNGCLVFLTQLQWSYTRKEKQGKTMIHSV